MWKGCPTVFYFVGYLFYVVRLNFYNYAGIIYLYIIYLFYNV